MLPVRSWPASDHIEQNDFLSSHQLAVAPKLWTPPSSMMNSECSGLVQVTVDAVSSSRRWRFIESLLISWHEHSSHLFFCSVLWALEGLIQMSCLGSLQHLNQLWVGTDCCSLQKETPLSEVKKTNLYPPQVPSQSKFYFLHFYVFIALCFNLNVVS